MKKNKLILKKNEYKKLKHIKMKYKNLNNSMNIKLNLNKMNQ